MRKLLQYLLEQGVATQKSICPPLDDDAQGLPTLTASACSGSSCSACQEACPTEAISVAGSESNEARVSLDLGCCIGCGLCIETCPTGTIAENRSTQTAASRREDLVLTNETTELTARSIEERPTIFANSLHARVVSTGCSSCDLEIGAAFNPIFDMERFGVHVVASPRYADALMVTGPVGRGMQEALKRCYEAMAQPRLVMAVGTCAISGGVHKGGYAEANGADSILPVNVYVPGCPPHPWSIIHGVLVAQGKSTVGPAVLRTK